MATSRSKPAAAGGEAEERWQSLIEAYGRFLRDCVSRLCPRRLGIQADEVEQEARIRLWRALQAERTITDPASYIYRISATAAIDAVRRVKARREEPLDESESQPRPLAASVRRGGPAPIEETLSRRLLLDHIGELMSVLPERRRQALGLQLQGFTTGESARLTGTTEPAARNLVYRALAELRARLRAEGIEYEGQ